MADMAMAARIRQAREARGISASDLARLVGVTPTAVWNWETNGTRPRAEALADIARVLAVTAEFLLAGSKASAVAEVPKTSDVASIVDRAEQEIARATGFARERVKLRLEVMPG